MNETEESSEGEAVAVTTDGAQGLLSNEMQDAVSDGKHKHLSLLLRSAD